jgi:hypothetical protein
LDDQGQAELPENGNGVIPAEDNATGTDENPSTSGETENSEPESL